MQLNVELNEKENLVSLDRIIDMVLENAEAEQHPQFDFMKQHDYKFMEEIKKYSHVIRNLELISIPKQQLETVIENQSSDLRDAMSEAGIAYLKHGMKLGAQLVLRLLY